MKDWTAKRYWLIGASDGLGAALARKLSKAGAEVIVSADVADNDSVVAAAKAVGAVDGVVFLAGVYWPFSARDWDADKANAMADVNFTGLMRVMGQVVPDMVARDAGHIVITSSLSAYACMPICARPAFRCRWSIRALSRRS